MNKGDTYTTQSGRVQHIVYKIGRRLDWNAMSETQKRKAYNRHTPASPGMPTIETAISFCGMSIDLPYFGKPKGSLCSDCVGVIADHNLPEIMRLAKETA